MALHKNIECFQLGSVYTLYIYILYIIVLYNIILLSDMQISKTALFIYIYTQTLYITNVCDLSTIKYKRNYERYKDIIL